MDFPRLRHLLLKSYFPLAFLVAMILLILDAITPPVVAQVRTVTVTVFVTITQQVFITWERTVMVTVATGIPTTFTSVITSMVTSAVTSILTQTSLVSRLITETSVVSGMVTQTATVTIAAGGVLGPMPAKMFGQYSDVALAGIGVLGGVAVGLVSSNLIGARSRHARLNDSLLQFDKISEAILQAGNSWAVLTAQHCLTSDGGASAPSSRQGPQGLEEFSARAKQIEEKWTEMPEELARYRQKIARDLL